MVDYNTAYLLIDDADATTAQFDLSINFEEATEGEKSFIMAERGQYIREVSDHAVNDLSVDAVAERRAGYWIDGGAGSITKTLQFETGLEDVTWGDGSGGTGPSNVTKTDASGADVKPLDRKQVLEYWLRRTRTDSLGPQARLHWGQWTDGTVSGIGSAGVYGEPVPVAVRSWNLGKGSGDGEQASMDGTLTLARVAVFPSDTVPSWVADPAGKIAEAIDGLQER